ncbi:MAG: hypothetical protein H6Q54_314 [Deltaproteobacteria bacterium]|nr:hypothetical protein [Deltaproteobacteria bacterium]
MQGISAMGIFHINRFGLYIGMLSLVGFLEFSAKEIAINSSNAPVREQGQTY